MTRFQVGSLTALLLLGTVLWAGCSSTSSPLLHSPYFSSRDGVLQYRLPAGWYDATADTQSIGHTVWLLRDDYAATIAVNELHIDDVARGDLQKEGIVRFAAVSMALAAAGKPYSVQQSPEELRVNGKTSCLYELTTSPTSDILRVVLVDTGRRVYLVTALVSGDSKEAVRGEVFGVQDAFLNTLRW